MSEYHANSDVRRSAFQKTIAAKDSEKIFPDQVFSGRWECFFFFQSDYIFSSDFTSVIKVLLEKELGVVACLLNLDRSPSLDIERASMIFVDREMSEFSYEEKLRSDKEGLPWIFGVDSYVCTSDVGKWCIYCEKGNDVAVLAFRDSSSKNDFCAPLRTLYADTIENLLTVSSSAVFPFNQLAPSWASGLLKNYGDRCSKP